MSLTRTHGLHAPRAHRLALLAGLVALTLFLLARGAAARQNASAACGTALGFITGNIEIENDAAGKAGANLFPGDSDIKNTGAVLDWVKDSNVNGDTASLCESVAVGIDPTGGSPFNTEGLITGALNPADGKAYGHWNGVRVVDGFGKDPDIFLTGGKENDVTTWNVGPGSTGSSKYDFTQGYLANSNTYLYAGFERLGNNGSTAFDVEFNQAAPDPTNPGNANGLYIPTRTKGDVLLTFEASGSGTSGSVVPHVFTWDGTAYVEKSPVPSGIYTAINNQDTPAGPWGHVDTHSGWVYGGTIPKFQFAEGAVPLSQLPGVGVCGGTAYVQFRTRSSATSTSDMKDATRIFKYSFGGPTAAATLTNSCGLTIHYDGTASTDASGGNSLSYSWTFLDANKNQVGTSALASGDFTPSAAGTYTATLVVTDTATACTSSITTTPITVFPGVTATATLTPNCDGTFSYSSTASGGSAPLGYSWTFTATGVTLKTLTSALPSGTVSFTGGPTGTVNATLVVTDSRGCSYTTTASTTVYPPVSISSASLTPNCDGSFGYSAAATGGNGTLKYDWTFKTTTPGVTLSPASATGASGSVQVTFNGAASAAITAEVTVTDQSGCSAKQSANTTVYPPISISSATLAAGCEGLNITYSGSASGGKPTLTYSWQFKDSNGKNVGSAQNGASGTFTAPAEGTYTALLTVTDGAGCTTSQATGSITVQGALAPTASKTGTDGTKLTVAVSGSAHVADSLEWQISKDGGANWTVRASGGATISDLILSLDDLVTLGTAAASNVTIGSDSYQGQVYALLVRLHAHRNLNGGCDEYSTPVPVKAVKAVDP